MKGLDIFIVRFVPFIIFVLFIVGVAYTCVKKEPPLFYYFHSNSVPYALSLFLISLSNKKYHCVWNRAMYLFLIIVPTLNYLEVKFDIFPSDFCYILFMNILMALTVIITAYLAIKHFVNISKRKLKNGSN